MCALVECECRRVIYCPDHAKDLIDLFVTMHIEVVERLQQPVGQTPAEAHDVSRQCAAFSLLLQNLPCLQHPVASIIVLGLSASWGSWSF